MSKKQETGKREASHINGEAAGRIVLVGTADFAATLAANHPDADAIDKDMPIKEVA